MQNNKIKHAIEDTIFHFANPQLIICVFDNKLIFTTKKIASRYFETLSNNTIIEFNVYNAINISARKYNIISNPIKLHNDIILELATHSKLNVDNFYNLLNITHLSDIFNNEFTQNYDFYYIVKDPFERLLSAMVENTDSTILAQLEDLNTRTIIEEKYEIEYTFDFNLRKIPIEKSTNIIIDNYIEVLRDSISDMHLSLWHTFLLKLTNIDVKSKINIIKIEDLNTIFYNDFAYESDKKMISNSDIYKNFIETHTPALSNIIKVCGIYLSLEYQSYYKLING
jgi:hypothetical protein